MSKRITIGFAVTNLSWSEKVREMVRGADRAAKKYGVDLLILPGREINATWYEGQDYRNYEYQFNSLYSFIRQDVLDAVIITLQSIAFYLDEKQFQGFLDWLPPIPTIFEGRQVPGYCYAHTVEMGFRNIIDTLVEKCGYQNILFVSGPEGNPVAEDRLGIYREILESHGIPYDPQKVYYGTFCQWGMDDLKDFIAGQKTVPQAICVANDTMATVVYQALEELNLRPGVDVAVHGYDNITAAATLHPPLATVKMSAGLLGYRMVEVAVAACQGEELPAEIAVEDQAIYRRSLGTIAEAMHAGYEKKLTADTLEAPEALLEQLKHQLYTHTSMDICYADELQLVWEWFAETVGWLKEGGVPPEGVRHRRMKRILGSSCMDYIGIEELEYILKFFRTLLDIYVTKEQRVEWDSLLLYWGILIHNKFIQNGVVMRDTYFMRQRCISNIVKEMLLSFDEEKIYYGLMSCLKGVGIQRAYLFALTTPANHDNAYMKNFQLPKRFLQKLCMHPDYWHVLPPEQQLIKVKDFWGGEYSTEDIPRTMILHPLFINTMIYGFMLCEVPHDLLSATESIFREISSALHAMHLTSTLQATIEQVREDNAELDIKAKTDVMTGIYNRRGFLEETKKVFQKQIKADLPVGFLMFIDLDNLKSINDVFGHEEGDFAICQAVRLVKNCIRANDIFARIGGDEFVVAALSKEIPAIEKLVKNIKQAAKTFNESSDKPYNVEMSIGIHFFSTSEPVSIAHVLDMADEALYEDKRKKNPTAVKQPKEQ